MFIWHRTAENNQRNLSHGFKNILFGDNMHYVDLYSCICIGVFGKSGTTKIWGSAFAPPLATPLRTSAMFASSNVDSCQARNRRSIFFIVCVC